MNRNAAILLILLGTCVLLLLLFNGSRQRGAEVVMAAKSHPAAIKEPDKESSFRRPAADSTPGGRSSSGQGGRPLPLAQPDGAVPYAEAESFDGPLPLSRELADLDRIIAGVQLTDASDLNRLYLLARRVKPELLSGFVGAKLKSGGMSPGERYNVIWIATRTNSPAMMPVWKGLLTREFPATAEEATSWRTWMKDHRNENLRLMQAEQLRAVSMIGALQESAAEAQDFLFVFAKNGSEVPGDVTMLRLEAARVIYQYNRNGLLRLAAVLSEDDPLRDQLSDLARIRRGDQ